MRCPPGGKNPTIDPTTRCWGERDRRSDGVLHRARRGPTIFLVERQRAIHDFYQLPDGKVGAASPRDTAGCVMASSNSSLVVSPS